MEFLKCDADDFRVGFEYVHAHVGPAGEQVLGVGETAAADQQHAFDVLSHCEHAVEGAQVLEGERVPFLAVVACSLAGPVDYEHAQLLALIGPGFIGPGGSEHGTPASRADALEACDSPGAGAHGGSEGDARSAAACEQVPAGFRMVLPAHGLAPLRARCCSMLFCCSFPPEISGKARSCYGIRRNTRLLHCERCFP